MPADPTGVHHIGHACIAHNQLVSACMCEGLRARPVCVLETGVCVCVCQYARVHAHLISSGACHWDTNQVQLLT